MKEAIKLPEAIAKSYKPTARAVQEFADADLGRINLEKINERMAEKLEKKGYLAKIDKKALKGIADLPEEQK